MSHKYKSIFLVIFDLILSFLALYCTMQIDPRGSRVGFQLAHYNLFSFLFPIWMVVNYIEGLYSLRQLNQQGLIISLIRSLVLSIITSFIFFYLFSNQSITPKTNIIIISSFCFIFYYLNRKIMLKIFSQSRFKTNVLAIGDEKSIDIIKEHIKNKPYLGYEIKRVLKSLAELSLEKISNIELVVIDRNWISQPEAAKKVFSLLDRNIQIVDLVRFSEETTGKIPINSINESWFIEFCGRNKDHVFNLLKNSLDKFVALTLILILFVPFILLVFILLITSGRPIFFTQNRVGVHGRLFKLIKLRSMRVDAEKSGAKWAQPNDSRITPIGMFLRKTRLDELPQLWNILKGEMSLVGPRPERPEFINDRLAVKIPFYNQRHLVKPGVTGWAQVNFRYGYSEDDSLQKLQYDLYYVKNKSFWFDISIILKTIKTVITGAGH